MCRQVTRPLPDLAGDLRPASVLQPELRVLLLRCVPQPPRDHQRDLSGADDSRARRRGRTVLARTGAVQQLPQPLARGTALGGQSRPQRCRRKSWRHVLQHHTQISRDNSQQ